MADATDPKNPATGPRPDAVAPPAAKAESAAPGAQEAADANRKAVEAREEAELAKLSPEERKAREAEREAARVNSEVAQAASPGPKEPDTVATARVHAPVDPGLSAADHMAQKFGNDPANPKPAHGLGEGYEGPMVRLSRKTPDAPNDVEIDVPEAMVGDYLRAGWNRP